MERRVLFLSTCAINRFTMIDRVSPVLQQRCLLLLRVQSPAVLVAARCAIRGVHHRSKRSVTPANLVPDLAIKFKLINNSVLMENGTLEFDH